jgi:TolB-like protein/DNA-binding winged helix-turn-helix (wHTH) protein
MVSKFWHIFRDSLYTSRAGCAPVSVGSFQFGEFKLDCDGFELTRAGRSLKVERMPMELLILLVAKNGQLVTRDEIAERLWQREVFVDTEHGINTAVRKIRMVLRDDPDQPRFVQTVTGKGYRFIAPITRLAGVPEEHAPGDHAIEGAGAFDNGAPAPVIMPAIKPATILSPAELASGMHLPRRSRRTAWIAVLAASGVLAIALVIANRVHAHGRAEQSPRPRITSLAVLPLDNLSGDPGQEYFADGMTDELTTMLAKDSTLRIVSRTSVMQYKGAHRPLPEIAQALGVDAILEGSVERANDKVHMTLQLIHAPTDTHLWADSYDRDTNDVVTLPADAAQAIAKRLHSSVASAVPARYINPEAHDAYLRGHYFWMVGRNEDAGRYFRQAVQIQPDYALGWAGLSEYYSVGALGAGLNPLEVLPKAEAAGRRAVELDDSLPQAHNVLGAAIFFNRWDGAEALNEVTRAAELDPEYTETYHLRAKILCALGRYVDAIAAQRQATAANPIEHPGARAEIFLCARQYDAAINDGRLRLEDFPAAPDVLSYLADSYHWKSMDKEAVEMLARQFAAEHNPQLAAAVRHAFQTGGYTAAVRCQLADLEKKARSENVSTFGLARFHAMLGQHDKTLALLDQALDERAPLLLWIQTDPAYDFLHSDERYRSIIRKVGLPPAW